MRASEFIRQAAGASGTWSLSRLATALGIKRQSLNSALNRGDMRVGFVARAAELLGYELVAVPRGSRLPNGSDRLDGGDGRD